MLTKPTVQLLEEVFSLLGEKAREKAQAEPEACLVSLLLVIKKRLPEGWATLGMTIEQAPRDSNLDDARKILSQDK